MYPAGYTTGDETDYCPRCPSTYQWCESCRAASQSEKESNRMENENCGFDEDESFDDANDYNDTEQDSSVEAYKQYTEALRELNKLYTQARNRNRVRKTEPGCAVFAIEVDSEPVITPGRFGRRNYTSVCINQTSGIVRIPEDYYISHGKSVNDGKFVIKAKLVTEWVLKSKQSVIRNAARNWAQSLVNELR